MSKTLSAGDSGYCCLLTLESVGCAATMFVATPIIMHMDFFFLSIIFFAFEKSKDTQLAQYMANDDVDPKTSNYVL